MQIFQIDENLFQSTKIEAEDIEQAKRFDVCIDLSGGIDANAADFKIYINWPIKDGAVLPDLKILKSVAELGYNLACKNKLKVLVHCNEGVNRASLLNGEILRIKGIKGREIVEYIRSKRPGALTNPYFENYLRNLN